MVSSSVTADLQTRLQQARELASGGRAAQAESAYASILQAWPDNAEAASRLARFALDRGDAPRAVHLLQQAAQAHPANEQIALDLALAQLQLQQPLQAAATLEAALARAPGSFAAWLLLGEIREVEGDQRGALKAWSQAVTRAQRAGYWHDRDSTPPHLLDAVLHAIDTVRRGRRELYFGAYDDLRARFGDDALKRVDKALKAYIGEQKSPPPDARQRPRFFYFPDLPPTPYLDPYLQPWAPALRNAFPVIRDEALRVFAEDQRFDDFVELKGEARMQDYIGGNGPAPAWEALFFYRHGQRYESTHERCPRTSAVLESIDLCRVEDEAPEICFSVLTPGSTILPHYGVTNTRSVMHLPLQVPPDCALNVLGIGEHHWREGELMMFDDTYQHEAWNRSTGTRIILLMDCWNPHLTEVERLAVKQLIETIGGLHRASQPLKSPAPGP
jgi:aspartate beta-hydroxylase